jgi:FkbH-like protein
MGLEFDFISLARTFSDALAANRVEEVWRLLRDAAAPTLEFSDAQSLRMLRRKLSGRSLAHLARLKLAVLSNHTISQLIPLLDLFLFAGGIDATIFQGGYGTVSQDILDPASALYSERPQIVFIATNWRDLRHAPNAGDSRELVLSAIEKEVSYWSALWRMAHERLGCQIIQNNFDMRPWRTFDNHDGREPSSLSGYVARLNIALADRSPPYVTIHDLDHLSTTYGRWAWGDEQYFHLAKVPCAPQCQVGYAHHVASLILAQRGLSKKCLVLDLDNTLWGGVVGDDGIGGIRLGQGDPEGEAYLAFQGYIKALRARGIILAVCSKNDLANAKEPFDKHPGMLLRLEDISCFVANWDDKAANIRAIATTLNIGLDSLVFVDDNPVERALVRKYAPEVAVPELPADPSEYIRAIDQHHYFQVVSLSAEDYRRADLYRDNAAREVALLGSTNMDEFLKSLRMTARVESVNDLSLERTVQLINKSNQFNLTTRRYTTSQIQIVRNDPKWVTRTISLADRFGDNGLISVLMAHENGDSLHIDTWLMSCRVLKRGVESLALNELVDAARHRGVRRLAGMFIPSGKNAMVAGHYREMGFTQSGKDENGTTYWSLPLKDFVPRENFIEVHRGQ